MIKYLLCIASLLCYSTYALSQTSQPAPVSIHFEGEPLNAAIKKLQAQTGISFAYDDQGLSRHKAPVLTFNQQPLRSVLNKLLENSGYEYQIIAGKVVIMPTEKNGSSPNVQAGRGPGTLKGRIVEFETSQPLPGASVRIPALNKGISSNESGYYRLEGLPAGKYALEVSFVSYKTETLQVTVRAGSESTYDVKLQGDNLLSEVVVEGVARTRAPVAHTTDRQLVAEIKNAQSVVSGISSEQIGKSADRNVAEVIRRISGVTTKDDKFIIVRGMNERYNLTYLNGNIAPSTELYSRAFDLSLLPTRIIDQVLVYKSPAPDLLADMTGGAVKILTKDAKTVRHFDIEFQTGYRQYTTFNKHFLGYKGSGTDFLGFDNGLRKLPKSVPGYGDFTKANISQATYAKTFSPILSYGTKTGTPMVQLTANYYDTYKLFGKDLSMLTSFSYKNEPVHNDIDRIQNVVLNGTYTGLYNAGKVGVDDQNLQTAQLSLLQNFTWHLRDSSSFYFKNFLLQQGQNATITHNYSTDMVHLDGGWQNYMPLTDKAYRDIILSWQQRFLYSGNVGGKTTLKKGDLNYNLGYTYSRLTIPDQRTIHLQNNVRNVEGINNAGDYDQEWIPVYRDQTSASTGGGDSNNKLNQGMISRTWTQNTEATYNGSVDYDFKWKPWVTFKAGTYQLWKQREVYRRIYTVNEGDLPASGEPDPYNPQVGGVDYTTTYFHQQDLPNVWSTNYLRDDGTGLKVFDRTSGNDAYVATEQNNSGYIAAQLLPFGELLNIYGGLRVEYDRQKVSGAVPRPGDINQPVLSDIKKTDLLPSVNISLRPNKDWVLRAGYGRTVNRPEFVELAPYSDLDYVNNQTVTGNPNLLPASIQNYDLRLEFYPKGGANGETISIGGFYKSLDRPIERTIYNNITSGLASLPTAISFQNAPNATIKGLEMDVRKRLDFIPGNFFRSLFLVANGTLIHSKVDSIANYGGRGAVTRQLQGQAPYSFNTGLYYDNAGTGSKIALIYNQTGPSIYAAAMNSAGGGNYEGSLLALTRRQLDFSFNQRIIKSLQLKFSLQNLLNSPVQMAEDANFTYKYEKAVFTPNGNADKISGDPLYSNYKPGRFFLLSLTYGF